MSSSERENRFAQLSTGQTCGLSVGDFLSVLGFLGLVELGCRLGWRLRGVNEPKSGTGREDKLSVVLGDWCGIDRGKPLGEDSVTGGRSGPREEKYDGSVGRWSFVDT